MLVGKRKYNARLARNLEVNGDFLIKHFQKEWSDIQKNERRRKTADTMKKGVKIIARFLLGFLLFGGLLTVALAMPGVFVVFDKRGQRIFVKEEDFQKIKLNFSRRRYVSFLKKDENTFELHITEKGKSRLFKEIFNNLTLRKNKKWDGKWRLAMFDIPNKHKWARNGFREKLQQLGFCQLQESVFIFPYPCEEEVGFLVSVFNVSPYVRFLTTSDLRDDSHLKEYFKIR